MEFEILNEIMTGTVAQLFTDLTKHSNFIKTSSQMGQDKSEIPKSHSSTDLFSHMGFSDGMKGSNASSGFNGSSDNQKIDIIADTPVA